jgi:hypothetical protein
LGIIWPIFLQIAHNVLKYKHFNVFLGHIFMHISQRISLYMGDICADIVEYTQYAYVFRKTLDITMVVVYLFITHIFL